MFFVFFICKLLFLTSMVPVYLKNGCCRNWSRTRSSSTTLTILSLTMELELNFQQTHAVFSTAPLIYHTLTFEM